jgi:hypothetical protein
MPVRNVGEFYQPSLCPSAFGYWFTANKRWAAPDPFSVSREWLKRQKLANAGKTEWSHFLF